MLASIQNQPKVFSAGLDILEMYGKSPERCGEFWKAVQEMWLKIYNSNMVTIAAINVRMEQLHPQCPTARHVEIEEREHSNKHLKPNTMFIPLISFHRVPAPQAAVCWL